MSAANPWEELGIAETTDGKAIRRAYAGRLRSIDQQKDPGAFQRLRGAYEWALNYAARRSETQPDQATSAPAVGAGAPYKLTTNGTHVSGCKDKSGASVDLNACLAAAGYSAGFTMVCCRS